MNLARSGFLVFVLFSLTVGKCCAQQSEEEAIRKGLDYSNKGMYDEAIVEFTKAIDANPRSAAAFYNRGLAYHKNRRSDEAMSDYTRAIAINPKDSEFYYNRGIIQYSRGNFDQAASDWSKGIEINPKNAAIYQKRAFVYFQMLKYDKAWEDIHTVEALGYRVESSFLESLKKASGREK
jgi:tetratricopeptide (TPR) repeat protein